MVLHRSLLEISTKCLPTIVYKNFWTRTLKQHPRIINTLNIILVQDSNKHRKLN